MCSIVLIFSLSLGPCNSQRCLSEAPSVSVIPVERAGLKLWLNISCVILNVWWWSCHLRTSWRSVYTAEQLRFRELATGAPYSQVTRHLEPSRLHCLRRTERWHWYRDRWRLAFSCPPPPFCKKKISVWRCHLYLIYWYTQGRNAYMNNCWLWLILC
jgi:hypothetical protein